MKPKEIFKNFKSHLPWDFNEIADKDCVVCYWEEKDYPMNAIIKRGKDKFVFLYTVDTINRLIDLPAKGMWLREAKKRAEFKDKKLWEEWKELCVLNGI